MYLCRIITPFGNFKEGEEVFFSLKEVCEHYKCIKILKKYNKIDVVVK